MCIRDNSTSPVDKRSSCKLVNPMKAPEKAPHNNGGCTLRSPVSPSSQTRRSQILYQFLNRSASRVFVANIIRQNQFSIRVDVNYRPGPTPPLRYTYSLSREIAQNDTIRKYCSLDKLDMSFDYLGVKKLAALR